MIKQKDINYISNNKLDDNNDNDNNDNDSNNNQEVMLSNQGLNTNTEEEEETKIMLSLHVVYEHKVLHMVSAYSFCIDLGDGGFQSAADSGTTCIVVTNKLIDIS